MCRAPQDMICYRHFISHWIIVGYDEIRYDTIRDAILTCAQKPPWVGLVYSTEPTTKKWRKEKLKRRKRISSEVSAGSPGNLWSQYWKINAYWYWVKIFHRCLLLPPYSFTLDRVSEECNAVGPVRPTTNLFALYLLSQLTLTDLKFCMRLSHDHRSQGHRPRSKVVVDAKRVSTAAIYNWWSYSSRFLLWRHRLRASSIRRAAWGGYTGSGGVQRVWAWSRGRSDLDP